MNKKILFHQMRGKIYYDRFMRWMLLLFVVSAKQYQFNLSSTYGNTRGDVQPLAIAAVQLIERGHNVNMFTDAPNQAIITDYIEEYFGIPSDALHTSNIDAAVQIEFQENMMRRDLDETIEVPFVQMTYRRESGGTIHLFSSHHEWHKKIPLTHYKDFETLARTGNLYESRVEGTENEHGRGIKLYDLWVQRMNELVDTDKRQSILVNFLYDSRSLMVYLHTLHLQEYNEKTEADYKKNNIYFAVSAVGTAGIVPQYQNYKQGSIFPTHQRYRTLPDDLQSWINDHQNIVVVAMGSMNLACFSVLNNGDSVHSHQVYPVLDSMDALLALDAEMIYSILFIVNKTDDQLILREHYQDNSRVFVSLPVSFQTLFARAEEAITLFCSHGGAGSVVESLSFGIPNMVFALTYDQPINGKFIADNNLGTYVTIPDLINGIKSPWEVASYMKTRILDSPECKDNAKHISKGINAETGIENLLAWLEKAQ